MGYACEGGVAVVLPEHSNDVELDDVFGGDVGLDVFTEFDVGLDFCLFLS